MVGTKDESCDGGAQKERNRDDGEGGTPGVATREAAIIGERLKDGHLYDKRHAAAEVAGKHAE